MEYIIVAIVVVAVIYQVFFNKKESGKSTTPLSRPAPAPAPAPVADVNGNGITSKAELKTLTKVQLVDFAEKNNLKVKKSGTKAAVINEIHAQLRDSDGDDDSESEE